MSKSFSLAFLIMILLGTHIAALGGGDTDCPSTGPDVVVSDIFDTMTWGSSDGQVAFTLGTNACNIGDQVLNWVGDTSDHPVISQTIYRIHDERLEQLGVAWLKHGYGALQNSGCACTCEPADFQHLGVGCADPYNANINGVQARLGPRREVDPHTGEFPFPPSGWGQSGQVLDRRMRVDIQDIEPALNEGVTYLLEAQYVSRADAEAGNDGNNVSWRSCTVTMPSSGYYVLELEGETQVGQTAVDAWGASDPEVFVEHVQVPGDGRVVMGSRVSEVRKGWYRYIWAVQNVTCNQSVGAMWMGINTGATSSVPEFHVGQMHDESVDFMPWAFQHTGEVLGWSTESFEDNPDANAIRWGTTATFVVETNVPPVSGSLQLDLFKPGQVSRIDVGGFVPGPGSIDPCDLSLGPCPWDIDGGSGVDGGDLSELLGQWGVCGDGTFRPTADINGDCCVDGADLADLLGAWGADCTPVGACCLVDGSCAEGLTGDACLARGGIYRGDGMACADAICPGVGACCLPDGSCVDQLFAGGCASLSGIFSPESSCSDLSCLPGADDCKDAVPLVDGRHLYSTLAATTGAPVHLECETGSDGGVVGNDIWFTYQPIDDGILNISTCDTVNYDSELLLYVGTDCADLVLLACNDDAPGCADYSSDLSASVESGTTYLVRVGGWRDGSLGTGELLVELLSNDSLPDDCSKPLRVEEGVHPFTTIGATTDGPAHPECKNFDDGLTGNDIWFIHAATGTGNLEVSTCGLVDYDSEIVVYANTECSDLVVLGCNDDAPDCAGNSSRVIVPVVEGQDYLIRLGGWTEGEIGSGEIFVQFIGE